MNVGDYVRTKDGEIDKVILKYKGKCSDPNCPYKHVSCERNYYDEKDIVKSSSNIIDLIEVGDYVNGSLVDYVGSDSIETHWCKDDFEWYSKEEIYSIVTKEQFERMKYIL